MTYASLFAIFKTLEKLYKYTFFLFNYFIFLPAGQASQFKHMAHKKAGGSTTLGRDSRSKRLGVKITDGQYAKAGAIIIRQRGTKYHPGKNVKRGNDDTLFATAVGIVKFTSKKLKKFNNKLKDAKIVSVLEQK